MIRNELWFSKLNAVLWKYETNTGFFSQFWRQTLYKFQYHLNGQFRLSLALLSHPSCHFRADQLRDQINDRRIPNLYNVKDLNPWNGLAFPLLKKVPSKIPEMILRRVTVKNGDLIKRILKYRFLKTGLNLIEFGNRRNKKSTMDAFTRYLARSKCGQ